MNITNIRRPLNLDVWDYDIDGHPFRLPGSTVSWAKRIIRSALGGKKPLMKTVLLHLHSEGIHAEAMGIVPK